MEKVVQNDWNPPPAKPYYQEVEYMWADCPWTLEEIEAFNPFPSHPPLKTQQPLNPHNFHQRQPPFKPTPPPYTSQATTPNYQHNFTSQVQSQHKIVAKGPKLSFPEFDGTDPDGWIRKAEKYFDLVGVSSEEKVQLAILYIKGKVEFWWRSTGCITANLPWHKFCSMITTRFNEVSHYEAIGQFHTLKQMGTVTEYIDKFEELMGLIKRDNPSLRDEYFTGSFVLVSRNPYNITSNVTSHPPLLMPSGMLEG
jgi:hypothetical protein